MKEREGNQLIQ